MFDTIRPGRVGPSAFDPLRRAVLPLMLLLFAVASLAGLAGCDSRDGTPETWADVSLDAQPKLFERRHGHPALADLEDLHLGQSREAAEATIDQYCGDDVLERGEGPLGGDATFYGCRIDDQETVQFVRVGFWPRLDNRVATLEVKRSSVPPAAVYRSFRKLLDQKPDKELLRANIVQLEYPNYRLFADWDQGLDGPTHLTVGFDPDIAPERVTPER